MQIKIKRVDKSLPLPEYKTDGAVCFDLTSRIDIEIQPQEIKLIPLNVMIKIPKGYFILMAPRSSLPIKKGLMAANSIGIFDEDYCGDNDEYLFEAYNFTNKSIQVTKGERVCQALLVKFEKAEFNVVDTMEDKDRGGIGSTKGYKN